MIYKLRGMPTQRFTGGFVLETHAGVGYQVLCAARTAAHFTSVREAEVWIFTHVKDDALCLYGFGTQQEREFFSELTSISGIGPKVALLILETLPLAEILRAAAAEEHRPFMQVSGIGERTARKLTLEIKHRLKRLQPLLPQATSSVAGGEQLEEVASALLNMGFTDRDVRTTLAGMARPRDASTEVLLRRALQLLTQRTPPMEHEAQQ